MDSSPFSVTTDHLLRYSAGQSSLAGVTGSLCRRSLPGSGPDLARIWITQEQRRSFAAPFRLRSARRRATMADNAPCYRDLSLDSLRNRRAARAGDRGGGISDQLVSSGARRARRRGGVPCRADHRRPSCAPARRSGAGPDVRRARAPGDHRLRRARPRDPAAAHRIRRRRARRSGSSVRHVRVVSHGRARSCEDPVGRLPGQPLLDGDALVDARSGPDGPAAGPSAGRSRRPRPRSRGAPHGGPRRRPRAICAGREHPQGGDPARRAAAAAAARDRRPHPAHLDAAPGPRRPTARGTERDSALRLPDEPARAPRARRRVG